MKKNNAAYSNLLSDPVDPGSSIMPSFNAARQGDHGFLLALNMNVTNFLNF